MSEEPAEVPILVIDEAVRQRQVERLEQTRARRDNGAVSNALEKLKQAARKGENTMPATIEHDEADDARCRASRNEWLISPFYP